MQVIHINDKTINYGKMVFRYRICYLLGTAGAGGRSVKWKFSARRSLIGVIFSCIDGGLSTEDEIVRVAARITRCTRGTVRDLLGALTGRDPSLHLWVCRNGHYQNLHSAPGSDASPKALLAA